MNLRYSRRVLIIVALVSFISLVVVFEYFKNEQEEEEDQKEFVAPTKESLEILRIKNNCFNNKGRSFEELTHEELAKNNSSKNIWFIETSCSTTAFIQLDARQLCAIESAAKNNPQQNIYVLFIANVGFFANDSVIMIQSVLNTYKNIYLRKVNLANYGNETPMKEWMATGKMFESLYSNSHLSDVLRYLTLYKFGGTYLDLDVVVLKDLEPLGANYSGAESKSVVAAGIMNFQGAQNPTVQRCLFDLMKNFNGFQWGTNGPGVITRVLNQICNTKMTSKMTKENCEGFNVYPPQEFYAVSWQEHELFFKKDMGKEILDKLQNSSVAHLWNKLSHHIQLSVGSNAAYTKLASQHCPVTYALCGEYF